MKGDHKSEKKLAGKSSQSVSGVKPDGSLPRKLNGASGTSVLGSSSLTPAAAADDDKALENEALVFLRDTVGIPASKLKPTASAGREHPEPWQCLSCLLSQVYDLFCRAGPEGDALFYKEVEQTKFERVPGGQLLGKQLPGQAATVTTLSMLGASAPSNLKEMA